MFWDKVAGLYDLFVNIQNGEVNRKLVKAVSGMIESTDTVLECACGTGMLSKGIAPKCKELIATDFSVGMLKEAKKNCAHFTNIKFKKADIMRLNCKDDTFDKVVAGNVIHLLDNPYAALKEVLRVCKKGGKVIIPTYINNENTVNNKTGNNRYDKKSNRFYYKTEIPSVSGTRAENNGQYDNTEYVVNNGSADNCLPDFGIYFSQLFQCRNGDTDGSGC